MALSGLGKFADLPVELRSQIWEHLRPENFTIRSDLHILLVSKQLLEEISHHIYAKEILILKLSPLYRRNSWITVINSLCLGVSCSLESVSHALSRGFANFPYRRLKGIAIEIPAPDPDDPGQFINLWTKICRLVELLQDQELPDINIHLLDTDSTSWMAPDGKPQITIRDEGPLDWFPCTEYDYEIVILPFCRLRNCRSVNIHAHGNIDVRSGKEDCRAPLEFYASKMRLRIPFGEFMDEEREGKASDAYMKERLDEGFLELDCALDILPGETARWLRLERFSAWFDEGIFGGRSRYVDEWERITSVEDSECYFSMEITHFRWRWRCMVAFNPCLEKMKVLRAEDEGIERGITIDKLFTTWSEEDHRGHTEFKWWSRKHWEKYYHAESDPENYKRLDREQREKDDEETREQTPKKGYRTTENVRPKDSWDSEKWFRFYPEGIPPLSKGLFFLEAVMGHL